MEQGKIDEAFARLSSLKTNLPDSYMVEDKYIQKFHEILSVLQQTTGTDLRNFRVPSSEVRPRWACGSYETGENTYTGPECERTYLLMQIDGLLAFFDVKMGSARKTLIGFNVR